MNALSKRTASPDWPCTIVTGATSGIGRELAIQLADAGAAVVAIGRDAVRLQTLAGHSPRIAIFQSDLSHTGELPGLVRAIVAKHPEVACLINNAGVQHDVRLDDAWQGLAHVRREVDINLVAPIVLTQLLLPHLCTRPKATVVNVTSSLAYCPKRTAAVYSATKSGLRLFTDALRVQTAGQGLRVVEVVLPLVDTPMTAGRGTGKVTAADAARQILSGLGRGVPRICVGKARWLMGLVRWWPGLAAKVLQRA